MEKRAQTGVEYLIVVGFVTISITFILVVAIFYSDQIKDSIKLNQAENFFVQLINSAESVFYSGEPSRTTIRLSMPRGVESIDVQSDYISVEVMTTSGLNRRVFNSRVPLQGSITPEEGIKKITLEAKTDYVMIS